MCVEWCKPSCVDAPYVNRHALFILKVCPLQLRLQSTKFMLDIQSRNLFADFLHRRRNLFIQYLLPYDTTRKPSRPKYPPSPRIQWHFPQNNHSAQSFSLAIKMLVDFADFSNTSTEHVMNRGPTKLTMSWCFGRCFPIASLGIKMNTPHVAVKKYAV